MSLGTGELIVLAFIILVVLSASRMGALGNALGKFVHSFRKASRGEDTIDVTPHARASLSRKPGEAASGNVVDGELVQSPPDKKK
jgi:sec-independent protein translocase protein TatA